MTVKEQQEWKIPPCISNWKNAKVKSGVVVVVFTLVVALLLIPLDAVNVSYRVTPFLLINVWLLMVGGCKRFTSMKTLPSWPRLSTSLTERSFPLPVMFTLCVCDISEQMNPPTTTTTPVTLQAREAVEMRAQVEKKMAQKEKEKKEEKLRELAQMARDHRAGIKSHGAKGERTVLSSSHCTLSTLGQDASQ